MTEHGLQRGGRRYRYLEAVPPEGTAQRGAVVLVHAFPTSARIWEPQLELADRGWRLLAPQLRGFGGGNDDPPALTMDDYADDVIALMDGLGVGDAVIAGVSMGGYIAFAILRKAAHRVRALVLANTRPQADTPESAAGRHRMLQTIADRGAAGVADEMVPKLLGASTRRDSPATVETIRSIILANSPGAIAGAVNALMTRPDSTALLAGIHCPTLIVGGDEDEVTPADVARSMHASVGASELEVIAKAGHLSNVEQPAAFNRALARFLDHRV